MTVYCDADYAGDDKTARSTTGLVILFAGAPIHWRSVRQELITTSSTEAELVSLCSAVKDTIWLSEFCHELEFLDKAPIKVYCDNQAAINIASNERSSHRTRHLRTRFGFLLEQVESKFITISHVKSDLQLADMLTKSISVHSFVSARNKLMSSTEAKLFTVSLLAIAYIQTFESNNFQTVKPIIYQPTDKLVDNGEVSYEVDFTYVNPCKILESFLSPYTSNIPPPQSHVSQPNQAPYNNALPVGDNAINGNNSVPNFPQSFNIYQPAVLDVQYVHSVITACNHMFSTTWEVKVNELLSRHQVSRPFDLHQQVKRGVATDIILVSVVSNFIGAIFERMNPWSEHYKIQQI